MKIAINTLSVDPEAAGIRTFFANITKQLPKIDTHSDYFFIMTKANKSLFTNLESPNFRKVVLPFDNRNKILKFFFEQFIIPILILRYQIDILFCPANIAPILSPCKIVLEVHGFHYALRPEIFSRLHRLYHGFLIPLSIRRATKVIAVSQYLKQKIIEKLPWVNASKLMVIYEGIDSQVFKSYTYEAQENVPIDTPYILFVGSLLQYKNVDKLIRAFDIVKSKSEIPHLLVIVGKDPHGNKLALQDLAQQLELTDQIEFFGPVEHAEIRSLYRAATLLVFPSEEETFGYPPLEAMASGIPVIGSNKSSIPEIIGEAGITVNPNDVEEMADSIIELINNKASRESLIEKGYARIRDFAWSKVLEQRVRIFRELYDRPGNTRE